MECFGRLGQIVWNRDQIVPVRAVRAGYTMFPFILTLVIYTSKYMQRTTSEDNIFTWKNILGLSNPLSNFDFKNGYFAVEAKMGLVKE